MAEERRRLTVTRRQALGFGIGGAAFLAANAVAGNPLFKLFGLTTAYALNGGTFGIDHCYFLSNGSTRYPAYCAESVAMGPNDVSYYSVSRSTVGERLMRGIDYILWYGYDLQHTKDDHYGYGLQGWDFMEATQYATWIYINDNDTAQHFSGKYGRHTDSTGTFPDWHEIGVHWDADNRGKLAWKMVSEARSHLDDTNGEWVGFATVYRASDGGQALILGGSRNGKAAVHKKVRSEEIHELGTYSIIGAEYTVYKGSTSMGVLTVKDERGTTNELTLAPGTYTVKETKAPKGYHAREDTWTITVESGSTYVLGDHDGEDLIEEEIVVSDELYKYDKNGKLAKPQGDATLANAEFELAYFDAYLSDSGAMTGTPKRSWKLKSDKDGIIRLDSAHRVGTGPNFYIIDGKAVLPLGTYRFKETKAPVGYRKSDDVIVWQVKED